MTEKINAITLALLISVSLPLLVGLFRGITAKGIVESVLSLLKTSEIILFMVLSIYLTKNIFFKEESMEYRFINHWIPKSLKNAVLGQDMIAYMIATPIILIFFLALDAIILTPIYTRFFTKMGIKLQSWISRIPGFFRHIMGMIWSIPRAIAFAVILGLGLNIFAYFTPDSNFSTLLNSSSGYEKVYEYAIKPMLHANVTKAIPLILNNTFAFEEKIPEPTTKGGSQDEKYPSNIKVIHYFNGVTLDEAVKSDNEIDNFARELTKGKESSRDEAKIIYKWIATNIKYDEQKAKNIGSNGNGYKSGAKVAFYTRNGICFDYASLYVAMCRANKIKVALVTGLAYNGITWGDHAWNRAFSIEENKWINVDPTFGKVDNYFDKKDFYSDHRYEKVREEWN